jgi:PST family polysaccharide transporter
MVVVGLFQTVAKFEGVFALFWHLQNHAAIGRGVTQEASHPPEPRSTAHRVVAGTALFMAVRWGIDGIGLISTIVLARLLVPEDFGLFAIAFSIVSLLDRLTDLSIRSSVIRHGGADRSFLDTVFTLQLMRGLVIAGIVFVASFLVPSLMRDPRLMTVMWALAARPIVDGLFNPRIALFERDLDFRRESALQLVAKLLSTAVAIGIVLWSRSYWALVAGSLTGALARLVLSYALSPFRPQLGLTRWRELARFAGWLSAATTADTLGHAFDNMIVGGLMNVRAAGIYNMSAVIAYLPLSQFLPVATRTLMPALLKFKDDTAKLRQNALEVIGILGALSFPIAVGFAFVAPELVRLLYGKQWLDAIPIIQALALSEAIESVGGGITTSVAMATGRTDVLFRRSVLRGLMRVPSFAIGTWLFGLPGAAAGYIVGSLMMAWANIGILRTLLGASYVALARELWRSAVAVGFMAILLLIVNGQAHGVEFSLGVVGLLAVKIVCGIVAYGGTRLLIWKITGRPQAIEVRLMEVVRAASSRIRSQN